MKLLFAFEGTGEQDKGKRTNWHTNSTGDRSFIYQFYLRSSVPSYQRKYFPGPDTWASNCGEIFREAVDFYTLMTRGGNPKAEIGLVGYSRGAYVALCFARYLEQRDVKVPFMALFDGVSKDFYKHASDEKRIPPDCQTIDVSGNVNLCYHAARSPEIGSRNRLMNRIGEPSTSRASKHDYRIYPGSHASMGGFPGEAGMFDSPIWGQGDPNHPDNFHPQKEFTAWVYTANFISGVGITSGFLGQPLVTAEEKRRRAEKLKVKNEMMPESAWYVKNSPIKVDRYLGVGVQKI